MSDAHLHYEAVQSPIWREGDSLMVLQSDGSVTILQGCERLAEWFRQQEDERIGRTRSKSHPHLVAYAHGGGHAIVIDENTGTATTVGMVGVRLGSPDPGEQAVIDVARRNLAYRLPAWHFAEPGELWELEWSGQGEKPKTLRALVVARPRGHEFPFFALVTGETVPLDADGIKSAKRVEFFTED